MGLEEVTKKEQEAVKAEALDREYDAREQTMDGLIGDAGEAAEAAEAYARAEQIEKGLEEKDPTAEALAADESKIDNTTAV